MMKSFNKVNIIFKQLTKRSYNTFINIIVIIAG